MSYKYLLDSENYKPCSLCPNNDKVVIKILAHKFNSILPEAIHTDQRIIILFNITERHWTLLICLLFKKTHIVSLLNAEELHDLLERYIFTLCIDLN